MVFWTRVAIALVILPMAAVAPVRAWAQSGEREVIRLWPQGLPAGAAALDAEVVGRLKAEEDGEHLRVVEDPELVCYPAPPDRATGTAVVVFPGGGYNVLAWHKEGTEIAEWFNSIGVSAFVLKYRVPRRTAADFHREPLQDAQRAIALVRHSAARWKTDPQRIGVLGFSAGGHLAVMTGLHPERTYAAVDEADGASPRPDFVCPIYGAYLGEGYRDDVAGLAESLKIGPQFPPTFQAVTWDDAMRGAQAAELFVRLKEAGVPAELHIWSRGGHGYGMRSGNEPAGKWPESLRVWLGSMGWLESPEKKGGGR